MSSSCPRSTDLLRLLDGEVTRNQETQLRAHLERCAACREQATRVTQLLEDIAAPFDPIACADGAKEVLRAIQEGREASPLPAPRKPVRFWAGAFAMAAAAALALWVSLGRGVLPQQTFQSRGDTRNEGFAHRVGIAVYAPIAHHAPLREGARIAAQTAFTAAYRNLEQKRSVHLLLFGLDSRGEIHWLYPAFTDANSDPAAIHLPYNPRETVLSDSVVLDRPALGRFRLFSVITPQPVHVSAIESLPRDQLAPAALEQRLPESHVEELDVVLVAAAEGTAP